MNNQTLTFLGAAQTVTGSKYLLEIGDRKILVDCGLFQGLKELRLLNWQPLPVPASEIDAVVLTHGHLDHCGYLPRLVQGGFTGRIFCTSGTADLCGIVLPDAGRIAEEDARDANRHGYTRHSPALPLFTETDAYRTLTHLQPFGFDRPVPVAPGIEARFVNAGHLLGSAFVVLTIDGTPPRTVVFSGDVGRYARPVLPDPSPVTEADILLVESTYGNRVHEPDDNGQRLSEVVVETIGRGGRLIIPAFAIGRVEEIIYWLKKLEEANRIPIVPVYVDSPMAVEALKNYTNHSHELDPDMRPARGELSAFYTRRFKMVTSPAQSAELATSKTPCIIISSSGMATGGRVLRHLKAALQNPKNTILFSGYQAAGTRGRHLLEGATEVKIHGRMVPVAAEMERMEWMSAHADSNELMQWLGQFRKAPEVTYVVHGEPDGIDALKARIEHELGWRAEGPTRLQQVPIGC